MSRIGKQPITLPKGVTVTIQGKGITVKGTLGTLNHVLPEEIDAAQEGEILNVTRNQETRRARALHGLSRALVQNMVTGVSEGYLRTMQIIGVGYSAERVGPWLRLALGYSHDILMEIPAGLTCEVELIPRSARSVIKDLQAIVRVKGINKQEVGHFSAEVRGCRPPENYKGKGVRYLDEHVTIKAGKAGGK